MVSFKNIFLLAGLASAFVLPRDYNTLLQDLQSINADVVKLTNDTNSYNGTAAQGNLILSDATQLDNDVNKTYNDTTTTTSLTQTQCDQLLNYLKNTVTPNVKAALDAIVAAKPKIVAAGQQAAVLADLKKLKADYAKLAAQAIKLCPGTKAEFDKIDGYFDAAIKAYSS